MIASFYHYIAYYEALFITGKNEALGTNMQFVCMLRTLSEFKAAIS